MTRIQENQTPDGGGQVAATTDEATRLQSNRIWTQPGEGDH